MKRYIKRAWHWMILLFATDFAFIFSIWIIRREALWYMSMFFLMVTLLVFIVGIWAELYRQRKDEAVLLEFLETPDERTEGALLERFCHSETVSQLCRHVLSMQTALNEKTVELAEYQEFIEEWVHEVKTPLSLAALVLSNHREEMSPYVYARMEYVQHQINEDVERILYYARLRTDHPDVTFTQFCLEACVSEVLDGYRTFLEEKHILLEMDCIAAEVISDRKIVSFLVSQLMSNASKYADSKNGKIAVKVWQDRDEIHLGFYNNGEGVSPEDMPFIFDKGFTGSYPNRQKATGMGLYLVRKYAEMLCVRVRTVSEIPYESGFGIELMFVL